MKGIAPWRLPRVWQARQSSVAPGEQTPPASARRPPRVTALDASPDRMERALGLLLGIVIGSALIGWALGRDWRTR